ncbi:MAG: FG-GAP repeat domain-containing protein [Candidatus Hodarchaeales archaeon]
MSNDTFAETLFSAWGMPRLTLPSIQVYAVETAVIETTEELLVCDERGDITAFEFQTPDRLLWARSLRQGTDDADLVGFELDANDFNGDGFDDLLVVSGENGTVYHENYGNGSIDSTGTVLAGALSIATGDFDGNGTIDIFGWTFQSQAWVLWNPGNDTSNETIIEWEFQFELYGHQSTGPGFQSISAGDIDNDGRDEVFAIDTSTRQHGHIYEFNGTHETNGTFVEKQDLGWAGQKAYTAFGDINGDGWTDFMMTNGWSSFVYLENLGNGTLTPYIAGSSGIVFGGAPYSADIALADLDNDGKDDLIVINNFNEVIIFWTSFVPPDSQEDQQDSNGLGFEDIMGIALIAVPIGFLKKKSRQKR